MLTRLLLVLFVTFALSFVLKTHGQITGSPYNPTLEGARRPLQNRFDLKQFLSQIQEHAENLRNDNKNNENRFETLNSTENEWGWHLDNSLRYSVYSGKGDLTLSLIQQNDNMCWAEAAKDTVATQWNMQRSTYYGYQRLTALDTSLFDQCALGVNGNSRVPGAAGWIEDGLYLLSGFTDEWNGNAINPWVSSWVNRDLNCSQLTTDASAPFPTNTSIVVEQMGNYGSSTIPEHIILDVLQAIGPVGVSMPFIDLTGSDYGVVHCPTNGSNQHQYTIVGFGYSNSSSIPDYWIMKDLQPIGGATSAFIKVQYGQACGGLTSDVAWPLVQDGNKFNVQYSGSGTFNPRSANFPAGVYTFHYPHGVFNFTLDSTSDESFSFSNGDHTQVIEHDPSSGSTVWYCKVSDPYASVIPTAFGGTPNNLMYLLGAFLPDPCSVDNDGPGSYSSSCTPCTGSDQTNFPCGFLSLTSGSPGSQTTWTYNGATATTCQAFGRAIGGAWLSTSALLTSNNPPSTQCTTANACPYTTGTMMAHNIYPTGNSPWVNPVGSAAGTNWNFVGSTSSYTAPQCWFKVGLNSKPGGTSATATDAANYMAGAANALGQYNVDGSAMVYPATASATCQSTSPV